MNELKFESLDSDLIHRYATNSLSTQERDAVELYFLEHPEVLDEIDIELQLTEGFSEAHELLPRGVASTDPDQSWVDKWFGRPWVGLSTTGVALALTAIIIFNPLATKDNGVLPSHFTMSAETLNLYTPRSGQVEIKKLDARGSGFVRIQVHLGGERVNGQVEITLNGSGGQQSFPTEVIDTEFAYLAIDTKHIAAGQYELTVTKDRRVLVSYPVLVER